MKISICICNIFLKKGKGIFYHSDPMWNSQHRTRDLKDDLLLLLEICDPNLWN